MRLLRLELAAFGSLASTGIDLACEQPCLHLVYGPNEAGKTTALRALHGLFYGIPEDTPDAHRFRPSELRVGALLCDARGRELYVVRRKGRKHTLLGADGSPLPAEDHSWVNAGVSEAQFRSMFALSYDTLEEGADELLGSAGELGQSLFSAGAGGVGAHAVLEALQREADAIYRPRGRTQRLNEALAAFEGAKRAVREQAIRSEAFSDQQRGIDAADAEARSHQLQRQELSAERARLERARRVLPLFAKRAEYRREREALGDVPPLPDAASDERRAFERAVRDASLRIQHVEQEVHALERDIAGLEVSPVWLAPENQGPLSELRDRLSQYRRAERALPVKRLAFERAREELAVMLERLGLHERVSLGAIGTLRLTRPFEAKLREQARRGETISQRVTQLARKLTAKRDEVGHQLSLLADLRGTAELRGLAESRGTVWSCGPAEPRDAEGSGDPRQGPRAAQRAQESQIELPLLGGGEARAPKREEARPKSERGRRVALRLEQIEEFEQGLAEIERELRLLADKRLDEERALEHAQRELDALSHAGEPPSEQQLMAARALRHDTAVQLRASLRKGELGRAEPQLDELESQVAEADVLADRLRREAREVAEYARLRAAYAASERNLQRMAAARLRLEQRAEQAAERFRALCAGAGVSPRSPAQLRALLSDDRAESARLEQLEREAAMLERELEAERAEYAEWRVGWHALATSVGCSADAGVAEIEALLGGLHDLFARADAANADARDIDVLAAECAAFERDLEALHVRLCLPCEPQSAAPRPAAAAAAADALLERHRTALRFAERRAQVETQLEARRRELGAAQAARFQAERELDALMRAARVSDLAGLEAAELAAAKARALEAALAEVQGELYDAADGFDLGELERDLGAQSMPELQARLQELEDALERCELARDTALQTLEARRAGLNVLRESRGAADAALEASAHLVNVRMLAQRWVRVRLAHGVLKREVERYRERHTGPILRGASSLFAQLTNGAWTGLEADFGDLDTPVLVCVRDDGERVGVAGLSAGTRDQLYLALRLASIEQLAAGRELLPLVMDDLLVHFDDDRARAAMRALGAFAATTQVLLFTHHARLCELAREALPPEQLRIHRLPGIAERKATELGPLLRGNV